MDKKKLMQICVNVAKGNLGRTGSNPSVGALIYQDGKIITGVTSLGGVPHAETIAIEKAKKFGINCVDAALFVTLEPCAHVGKTPPCVDAIITAGFSLVVIGMVDPDKRTNGNSIAKLKNAGITVEILTTKEIKDLYRAYLIFKCSKRPFICLKIASSLDGKIALQNGKSKWITSRAARKYTNFLRSKFNGIVIGANTYRRDFPLLDCRIPGLERFSPKKIIVSSGQIEGYASITGNVEQIVEKLYQDGMQSVLIEGGANLITQFIKAKTFDEIVLIQAPMFLGSESKSCVEALSLNDIPVERLKIVENKIIGGNLVTHLIHHCMNNSSM